ncbi:Lethal(2) giant larvae sro7 [Malassezia cuniculi]|uniref:Lethal(2) giant larvae sro7 n=1 Tax=Malassezia cuniculi TaxID=948313 RepID=A0AAF0EQN6_9BASI|nr:Lethal(2) giant larvae sro7 [Malassezia cuniculi]
MPPKAWLKNVARHAGVPTEPSVPLAARLLDWTGELRDQSRFTEGMLDELTLPSEITAMAYEPGLGVLAVGTMVGTVHLFGAPTVRLWFELRPAVRVKHLVFKSDAYLLVAIDEKDNVSVYDLSRLDPKSAAMRNAAQGRRVPVSGRNPQIADVPMRVGIYSARNNVLCAETSTVHNHLLLGLADGTVETYDLERFSASPYKIPNLWWHEEEILRRSNVPDAPSRLHVPLIIAIAPHPKDVNVLLLCYEGGAILYSLTERSALRTYQLRLLPGAPGPDHGAPMEHIWSERLCAATSIAWRPDGEVFAMGHDDGCISFWSAGHDDRPLLVRSLTDIDIDRPVAPEDLAQKGPSLGPCEPIFKLTWSAFTPSSSWGWGEAQASGPAGTILTVMGGTPQSHNGTTVHALHLPEYTPASVWTNTPEAQRLVRQHMRDSLETTQVSCYTAHATVEDYILLPRINPHSNGAFDPYAILILTGASNTLPPLASHAARRSLEVYSFPPALETQPQYEALSLPLPLTFTGRGTVIGARYETLPLSAYRALLSGAPAEAAIGSISATQHMAGFARPNVVGGTLAHAEGIARNGRPRVLITWHLDGCVRIHDVSPHLLLLGTTDARGAVLTHAFPNTLAHLTVDLRQVLAHPALRGASGLSVLQQHPERLLVRNVHAAWDALELAIQLETGHVFHFAYADAGAASGLASSMADVSLGTPDAASGGDQDITPLDAAADVRRAGFKPNIVVHALPSITSLALSDAGLLAMASNTMLLVVDCHGHDIVLRAGCGNMDFYSRQLGDKEQKIISSESKSEIAALRFAACRTAGDSSFVPRLVVARASGFVTIWTLERTSLDSWLAYRSESSEVSIQGPVLALEVLDPVGMTRGLTKNDVIRSQAELDSPPASTSEFCVLLVVSSESVALYDRVTGARVDRYELHEQFTSAHIVDRRGKVLVLVSPGSIYVLSLPRFDTSFRMQRHTPPAKDLIAAMPSLASIESQGDFVEISDGHQLRLWSVFSRLPHGGVPSVCIFTPRALPIAPGSGAAGVISSVATGWFGRGAAGSLAPGAAIDALLAGPRRPAPPQLPPQICATPAADVEVAAPTQHAVDGTDAEAVAGRGTASSWYDVATRKVSSLSDAARYQAQLNMQLLHKRDEILSDLDEGVQNLEERARSFFKNTRNMAIKAAAREKINEFM